MRAVLLLLGLVACSEPGIVVGQLAEVASLKARPNRNLDLLFVVDNSPSMADNQVALAASFPRMVDVLEELDGGLPNLHIGIVTSDMGTQGSAVATPGPSIGAGPGACSGTGDNGLLQHAGLAAPYIEDLGNPDGSRQRNYTGALRDVFATAALVGDTGCGFEQHLAAMRAGLASPANAGFLRDDANLAVVILADEDDCSLLDPTMLSADPAFGPLDSFRCFQFGVRCSPDAPDVPGAKTGCVPRDSSPFVEDVAPFAQFLTDLKGDDRKVMVAGIVGDPGAVAVHLAPPPGGGAPIPQLAHGCLYGDAESADPAVRLAAFLDELPGRSQLTSICGGDLADPLHAIGQSAKRLVGDPCLDTALLADSSPDPGVQPACEVSDVSDATPLAPTTLARCTTGAPDCYDLVEDPAACPATPDHLRVRINRSRAPGDDTWTHVRCQLAR